MPEQRVAVRLSVQNAGYNAGLAQSERSTDKLEAALARLDRRMRSLDRRPINVTARLDATQLEAELRRLSNRRSLRIDVTARLDTSTWRREAQVAAAALRVTVNARLATTARGLRASITGDFAPGTEARLQRQLDGMRLSVRVRPNVGPLPTLSAGSGGGGGGGLATGLVGGAAGLVAVLPQAISLLSAATSGATALVGQLGLASSAAAGIAPALGAAAQAVGVVKLGTGNVTRLLELYKTYTTALAENDTKAATNALLKYNERLADTGKNQAGFVRELVASKAAGLGLRDAIGESLFAGTDKGLRTLVTQLLPMVRTQLVDTGGIVSRLGNGLVTQLAGPLKERLGGALSLNNDLLVRASPLVGRLLSVALSLYNAVGPLALRIVDGANGLAKLADESASAGVESGKLVGFFDRAGDRAGELLRGVGNLAGGLRNVFKIGSEDSTVLRTFEDITQRFEDFTSSVRGETALRRWFAEGREAGGEFRLLLGDIMREFGGLSSGVDASGLVGSLRGAVPIIADIVRSLSGGGETGRIFAQAISDIVATLDRIDAGNGVRAFIGTLSSLVTTISEIASAPIIAPALEGLAIALGSVAAVNLVTGGLFRLAPALVALATPAGAAALLIGGVSLALFKSRQDAREAEKALRALADLPPLDLLDVRTVDENRFKLKQTIQELADFKLGLQGATDVDTSKLAQLERDAAIATEQLAKLDAEQARVNETSARLTQELGLTNEQLVDLAAKAGVDLKTSSYEDAANAIGRYKAETGGAAQASRDLAADLATMGDASSTAGEKADALSRIMQGLSGGQLDAEQAAIRFTEAIAQVTASIETNGVGLGQNTAAGRENSKALIEAKEALDARLVAAAKAGAGEEELKRILDEGTTALGTNLTATKGSKEEIVRYQEILGLTPEAKTTLINTVGHIEAERTLRGLQGQLLDFNKEYSARIVVTGAYTGVTNLGAGAAASTTLSTNRRDGGPIPALASGGAVADVAPGGYVVNAASTSKYGPLLSALGVGLLRGPGTGRSDSILGVDRRTGRPTAKVSNGEGYASPAVTRAYGPLLAAINADRLADGGSVNVATNADMSGANGGLATVAQVMVQLSKQMIAVADAAATSGSAGTAQGKDAILSFIRGTDPLPYIWGGVGPNGYDCSGLVGEVLNRMIGRKSYSRAFTTASIAAGQYGLKPGTGGTLSIGVTPGSGHMAGEYGGLPFEAESTKTGIKIGSAASSVNSFARKFHLAQGGIVDEIAALGRLMDVAGDPSELVINDRLVDSFDRGGEARGIGWMRKDVIAPERTLSPAMTPIFDRFVQQLERTDPSSWVRAPGGQGAVAVATSPALERMAAAFERGEVGRKDVGGLHFYGTDLTPGDVVSELSWEMR